MGRVMAIFLEWGDVISLLCWAWLKLRRLARISARVVFPVCGIGLVK